MDNFEEEKVLGIQSVYNGNPIQSIKTNNKKNINKSNNKANLNNDVDIKSTKSTANTSTSIKNTYVEVSSEECQKVIALFSETYKNLPKFDIMVEDFRPMNKKLDERNDWLKELNAKIKRGEAKFSNEEWKVLQNEMNESIFLMGNLQKDYSKVDLFKIEEKNIEDFKSLLFNDSIYEGFKRKGYGDEYLKARKLMQEFLQNREQANKLYNEFVNKYSRIKKNFAELEDVREEKSKNGRAL